MLILGLDPGTATTGYGLVKINGKNSLEAVEWGLIETSQKDGSHGKRFTNIHSQLGKLLKKYSPDAVAIEKLFFATNVKTAVRVGQAQGVMLLAIAQAKLPAFEYAPGRIKRLVSGNGRADKEEVQKAVRKHLGAAIRKKKGKKTHFDNAADALAVAICHVKEVIQDGENESR